MLHRARIGGEMDKYKKLKIVCNFTARTGQPEETIDEQDFMRWMGSLNKELKTFWKSI